MNTQEGNSQDEAIDCSNQEFSWLADRFPSARFVIWIEPQNPGLWFSELTHHKYWQGFEAVRRTAELNAGATK